MTSDTHPPVPAQRIARLRSLSLTASLAASALGILSLTPTDPGTIGLGSIDLGTAACIILIGLAILCRNLASVVAEDPSRILHRVATGLAGLVAALSATGVAAHVIDPALISDSAIIDVLPVPSEPSAKGSFCLMLAGVIVAGFSSIGTRDAIAYAIAGSIQVIVLMAILIAWALLSGSSFQAQSLNYPSLSTAFALGLIGLAMYFRALWIFSQSPEQLRIAKGWLPVAGTLAVGILAWQATSLQQQESNTQHAQQVAEIEINALVTELERHGSAIARLAARWGVPDGQYKEFWRGNTITLIRRFPDIQRIAAFDSQGNPVAGEPDLPSGEMTEWPETMTAAMARAKISGEVTFSDVFQQPSETRAVTIIAPVYKNLAFLGHTVAVVDLEQLIGRTLYPLEGSDYSVSITGNNGALHHFGDLSDSQRTATSKATSIPGAMWDIDFGLSIVDRYDLANWVPEIILALSLIGTALVYRMGRLSMIASAHAIKAETALVEASRDAQARKDAEEKLRLAVESIPEGFVFFGADEKMVLCNARYQNMFAEFSHQIVPGIAFRDIIALSIKHRVFTSIPEDAQGQQEYLDHHLAMYHSRTKGSQVVEKTATGRYIRIEKQPLEGGGVVGLRIDVTELVERETKLVEAQERVEQAQKLAKIGDFVYLFDDQKFTRLSSQARVLFGFTDDVAVIDFTSLSDLTEGQAAHRIAARPDTVRTTAQDYADGFAIVLEDGTRRHIQEHGQPIMDDSGTVIGFSGTFQDVTEQKQAELALQKIVEEQRATQIRLEKQSNELTQMAHDISMARDEAEAASKVKSEFLAAMSHEIRTPMNGVLGMTDLLLGTSLTDEQRKFTEIAQQSASDLLTILNDILDFSKLEANRVEIEHEQFDLRELLEKVIELLRPQASRNAIDLTLNYDAESGYFTGDSTRIRQILFNLIGNAIKFTENGYVTVNVMMTGTQGVSRLRIEVVDSGIGIKDAAKDTLFNSFTQADSSTSRKYGGTGLGLAICKQLVELMNGKIGFESTEGIGSTFWFELQTGHAATAEEPEVVFDNALAQPTRQLHILLVEDNAINQMIIGVMLQKLGHTLQTVDNGLQAINALRNNAFDLVFMDIQMPEMDGPTATQWIRESGAEWANIPIIALTANALDGDRERFLEVGMSDYATKPVTIEALAGVVFRQTGVISPDPGVQDQASDDSTTGDTDVPEELSEDAVAALEGLVDKLNKLG